MLKLGTQGVSGLYLGGQKIVRAYLGDTVVFDSAPPITVYTITAAIDPAGAGTVTGAGQYQEGETVTLKATVADGYKFTGWKENSQTVSTSETYTFTTTGDRALVAAFEAKVSRLPVGYTEVEYIQTDAAQLHYFSTGRNSYNTAFLCMDFEPTEAGGSTKWIFDSYYDASSRKYIMSAAWTPNGVKALAGQTTDTTPALISVNSNTAMRRMSIEFNKYSVSLGAPTVAIDNGEEVNVSTGTTSYSPSAYISIGGRRHETTPSDVLSMKIYSVQIGASSSYDTLVPCIRSSDSIAGLFGLSSKRFYESANNPSTVTAGSAV